MAVLGAAELTYVRVQDRPSLEAETQSGTEVISICRSDGIGVWDRAFVSDLSDLAVAEVVLAGFSGDAASRSVRTIRTSARGAAGDLRGRALVWVEDNSGLRCQVAVS